MAEAEGNERLQDQLDSVLSRFYDFGDDFHTPQVAASEKEQENEDAQPEKHSGKLNNPEDPPPPTLHFKKGKKNASLFFNSIKDELYNQPKCTEGPINSDSQQNVKVVKYVSHKNKKKTESKEKDPKIRTDSKEGDNGKIFDFEKVRLEVHKFGIKGFKKEKQRKFETARAIMLGAKPPKREYVNYKLFQEKKKELDQARKDRDMESDFEPVKKKQKPGLKDRKIRKPKGLARGAPDGQVGKFRDGALILSSKDIEKIKLSKFTK